MSDRLDVPGEGGVDEGISWVCGSLLCVHQPLAVEGVDILRVWWDLSRPVQPEDERQLLIVGLLVCEVLR